MIRARLVPMSLLLTLAACGGKEEPAGERTTAAGEVLGGTVSDAMLPLDTVRSQNPPLRETGETSGAAREDRDDDGDDDAPASPGTAASPAPAPSETPETAE